MSPESVVSWNFGKDPLKLGKEGIPGREGAEGNDGALTDGNLSPILLAASLTFSPESWKT